MKFRKSFLKAAKEILTKIGLEGVLITEDEILSMWDITPVEMSLIGSDLSTWVNPDMDEFFQLDEDNPNHGEWDTNNHRMWIYAKGKKGFLHVVLKAPALTLIEERLGYYELGNKGNEDPRLGMGIYQHVFESILIALTEDTWSPGGEQFCFTEFGEKIGEFLNDSELNFSISPDIGMCRDLNPITNKYEYSCSS